MWAPAITILALITGPSDVEQWRPPELAVKAPPPIHDFEALREIAFSYLGRPYVMGGVGSPAFDCSGFVCRVYAEAGYGIPRVSRDQVNSGAAVDLQRLLPGDLLFFAEQGGPVVHVGIYLGGGELVHASSGQGEVVVAELGQRWFQQRLVGARRVLARTSTEALAYEPAPTRELVEHRGDSRLFITLRRPSRSVPPSFGPALHGMGATSVGVRGVIVTEAGRAGLTLAPEATLALSSIALVASIAVPIRFTVEDPPTVGTFDRPGDYLRFLRTLSLGLPGADLELTLSRLGDRTLLSGYILDRLAPATEVSGVPGLVVGHSPLSFFGHLRTDPFRAQVVVDDVVDPAIFGLGASVPLTALPLEIGFAVTTDQRARYGELSRTISAAEGEASFALVDRAQSSLDARVHAAAQRALGHDGFGAGAALSGEFRFGGGASALSATLRGGWLGAGFLERIFGLTYPTARVRHTDALVEVGHRGGLGGDVRLRWGRVVLGGGYAQGVGAGRHPFDRQLDGVIELRDLHLGGTRLLDLRAVYAARAPFGDTPTVDVVEGAARLRFTSWLSAEAYLRKGETLQGGGGLNVSWAP